MCTVSSVCTYICIGGSSAGIVLGAWHTVPINEHQCGEAGADSGHGEVLNVVPLSLSLGVWGTCRGHIQTSIQSKLMTLSSVHCVVCVCMLHVQLMDTLGTGQMTFGAFTQLFGVMSRTTLQVRVVCVYVCV